VSDVNYLLLSDSRDFTTDYVSLEFEKRGENYLRLDRDLLKNYKISWDILKQSLIIEKEESCYSFTESSLLGVYYRAPTYLRETFSRNRSVSEQLQQSQWMAFYRNLVCFDNARWMNSPSDTFNAENKMVQLQTAIKVGFKVPETLVTNTYNSSLPLGVSCQSNSEQIA